MPKSKFGQAHCEAWFKRSPTKFILKFLDIPTSFYKFSKFALFSEILKQLKNDKNRRTVSGLKLAHGLQCSPGRPATRGLAARPNRGGGPRRAEMMHARPGGRRRKFGRRRRLRFKGERRGGGPEGWAPCGGEAGEREGERGGLGVVGIVPRCGVGQQWPGRGVRGRRCGAPNIEGGLVVSG
jgi:hypothetical protein